MARFELTPRVIDSPDGRVRPALKSRRLLGCCANLHLTAWLASLRALRHRAR
jgi:hypothetical protein